MGVSSKLMIAALAFSPCKPASVRRLLVKKSVRMTAMSSGTLAVACVRPRYAKLLRARNLLDVGS